MEARILQKAEDMISVNNRAIKDFETVCHTGICPTCGETLILHRELVEYIEDVGIIFKKEVTKKCTDTTIACPKGHKLIHPKGHDVSDPGYCIWGKCLNKEINDHWKKYYVDDDDFGS